MPIPASNRDDVLYSSGVFGDSLNFLQSKPDSIETGKTGDALIEFEAEFQITAGATSGDKAFVRNTRQYGWLNVSSDHIYRHVFHFGVKTTTPWTDEGYIGIGAGTDRSAGLELHNERLVFRDQTSTDNPPDSTYSLPTINDYDPITMMITQDNIVGETRFAIQTRDVAETWTVSNTRDSQKEIIYLESQGADDRIQGLLYDWTVIPSIEVP